MPAITTSIPQLESQTRQLAQQWGFEFTCPSDNTLFLELTDSQLQLVQTGKNSPGPIVVDFISGQATHRRRFGGGKGQTIARAAGLSKSSIPLILDATAGLGNDAFVFASLGANVILMERSTVSAALLEDGLERGRQETEISTIINRMHLIHGDSLTLLPQLRKLQLPEKFSQQVDVIYLDPMFPRRHKTAQAKKEMSALQQLVGADNDSGRLLEICHNVATKRIVVKRPIKAEYLAGSKPSFSMPMKKHRFDIYLT
jgi:16S rRNA (guanine1516-N2)-methyltransferase